MLTQEVARWLPLGGLALLIPFWQQATMIMGKLRSYVIIKTTVVGKLESAVISYLETHYRATHVGDKIYRSSSFFVKPMKQNQLVGWEDPKNKFYWKGMLPVILYSEPSKDGSNSFTVLITIRGFDVRKLLEDSLREYNWIKSNENTERPTGRFRIRRITGSHLEPRAGKEIARARTTDDEVSESFSDVSSIKPLLWDREDIGNVSEDNGAFAGLSFPPEVQIALKEFDYWLASREWYEKRSIPWRRGWLAYGPPGTGKSRLARALGQYGNMPIFSYDLATLNNGEFQDNWGDMLSNTPCMALFEDFDAVFRGRDNVTKHPNGLTFDCLLNTISGAGQANGVFLFITTNKLELIDEAIGLPKNGTSTRPGRIDRVIEVGTLPEECRREIASYILDEWPDEVERIVETTEGFTGAQVTDMCIKIAEKKYWENVCT